MVRAPPRVLPRSLAPSGVLVGGAVRSRFPPTWLGVIGVAVGRPRGGALGRPGSGALPAPTARPLGGLPGPVWGVRGRTLSHPRLPALWAGCRGRCGASGVGHSPTPDCSPSGRAAGAGVGRPGSDALPPPTARPLGWLPGPVWGVRGRTLSHPRLPALWAGCRGRCGASGVGLSHPRLPARWAGCRGRCGASGVRRSPTPDCSPSGRAAWAGVGRPGADTLPSLTARPLGGLPGPVWGVRGRPLSHPRLLALRAGCWGRCGASGVGRAPTPDCPPSGWAAGAGVGRPGSGALPPPTARPLGGLPGPVWGVRSRTLSHPRLPALWAGCRGPCGASGVGRSPTPDCSPSGRAAGAAVGRPGSDALSRPTARPLGGLPGPVWGVRGRTLSQPRDCPPSGRAAGAGVGRPGSRALPPPRLPALWAGCRGRCGASGVGRSPTPDCSPSGRAAGAGVGRPGSHALPPPTARPLGGLPGPVWGVRGRTLSHARLLALWAGCRGRCGASGVGRSPTPYCSPSGRAAGAGVGRPGSGALPPPTARPLGGLPGPVWGVRRRRSPIPDCPPSARAAGAGVGRPGSGALSPPTARPLGGLPGPVWGVRGRRSPTPDCPPSGRAAGAGVGRPGSGAPPPRTARPLGGLPGPQWGVRGRTLSHPRLPALWAGCRGRCGASGVGRSPTPDCLPSGRAAGAGVGRPGSHALPPPTARPLGGLPGPVWGVRGRAPPHPGLPALWAGCRGRCGASRVGHSPTPDCPPSGRAAGAGVGRPGSDALPTPTARPLGRLLGPVWGVRGRALSHPRLLALWAGCWGRCGASGVWRSPTPDCSPSGQAAGAGVGCPGSGALPPPTARPLGGLPGPVWGVRGRTLSLPRLPALWAGCWGRCGVSGVGRSPTPDCSPSGRAAGAGVGRPGSGALPPPTARPLGGLPGPVWGVRRRALSHPRLPALWAGCRGRCGASGVGRSPTPDCPPSGRAAGAGVGRPGSGALPPPTARPLGGLPGPVWGVRGRTLSHPRLPALWAGCRGRCGASGVGRSPTPDCSHSGGAAGAGVGRPGSDALPPPTARPLGGLPGPVWGVRGRALSHPQLLALWADCRGRCGASGVGRSPTPDCPPSGRAAGAGVGRPGSDALPPPTACPLGGLPGPVWRDRGRRSPTPDCPPSGRAAGAGVGRPGSGAPPPRTARPLGGLPGPVWGVRVGDSPTPDCPPSGRAAGSAVGRPGSDALPTPTARPLGGLLGPVWGVRGRALPHPRLLALWAGCRGRFGASGVGRSPTPDCPPSGRAAKAGVGRPGSDALPPPTARPLGGLPGPVWGVRGRALSHPRLPALWAGCRGRCGGSGVGHSPTPDCPPSGRAAGAGVGRPGLGALPPPTARTLGGLPGPVWGVRGRTLSHPRLPALWAGCRGRCGASGVGPSPTPNCSPSGRTAGAGVGRPGSDALPPPIARPLGGLPGPVWGVRGRALSRPRLLALWAGCRRRCGASWVGRSPTPYCLPSGPAAGAGVGRPGSGALPPPTARPLGGPPGPLWGVRGRTLSPPRLSALWAGCRGRCGASRVGRSPTPDCLPSGRAAGAGVGRPGSGALPPPTACPSGGLPGCCACACPAWLGWAGRPPGRVLVRLTFSSAVLASLFACSAPSGLGLPCLWLLLGFFASCPPPLFFFPPSAPSVRPVVSCFACFPAWGALGLGVLLPPPPPFCFFFGPPHSLLSLAFLAFRLPLASAPPPFFFSFFFLLVLLLFFLLRVCCVCSGVSCCVFPVLPVRCAVRVACSVSGGWCCWFLVSLPFVGGLLVALFARRCRLVVCVGSGARVCSGRRWASSLWCPVPLCCVLWRCAAVWCCAVVPCLLCFFFFVFLPAGGAGFLLFPGGSGSGPVPGRFCFCALPVRCCAGVPAPLPSVRCSLALAVLAGVLCCCLLCLCVCCWAWLSSVVSWWALVAPGVVSRWRAVVCPWVLCCAVLLRVVPLGVALLCTVLFRFAPFGAAARRAVSWGAVPCLGVLCLLEPCFVLSPCAVCVLLWCVAAWCCAPLCFVPCAPWGVVLCLSCRPRPVRCCCVARSPSVPCFPVLCPVVLCCRVVPWCPVLPPCWVCFLRRCGCTYLKKRRKLS